MDLRTKILVPFALLLAVTVVVVTWRVSAHMREAFSGLDELHTAALAGQLQREFELRAESLAQQVAGIAHAESTLRLALDMSRPNADLSLYVNEARDLAAEHHLDFLELVADDGGIISSAQWPARFGYKEQWLLDNTDWDSQRAFARQEELPNGSALAIEAVRTVKVADKKLYIVAGRRLSVESVRDLAPLGGIDVFLYRRGAGAAAGELEKVSTSTSNIDSGLLLARLNELGAGSKKISVNAPQQLGPAKAREGSAGHIQGATQTLAAEQQFHVITF